MIYLIGGPPKCGKSTLARALAEQTGAAWLPLDSIESVIYHYLPQPARSQELPLLPGSNDQKYATHSTAAIIANYRTRARSVWPAIQLLIHFA